MVSSSVAPTMLSSALLHAGAAAILLQWPVTPRTPRIPEALVVLDEVPVPGPRAEPVSPQPLQKPAEEVPTLKRRLLPTPSPEAAATAEQVTAQEPAAGTPVRLNGIRLSSGSGAVGIAEAGFKNPGRASGPDGRGAHPFPASPKVIDVPLANLSEKPKPPNLDGALRRHYPGTLQARGIEGEALVRAAILPSGRVGQTALLGESEAGFGRACIATLKDSVWSSPRDTSGAKVSTTVRYRCQFRIGR